jgi:eukaryotic-like serine/threonine-protein kinase
MGSRGISQARPTELTPETRRFLQHRVARLGLILGVISSTFLLLRVVGVWAQHVIEELGHATFALHLCAAAVLLGTWLLLRGERIYDGRAIFAADLVSVVGSSLFYIGMGFFIPMAMRPDLMIVLILSYSLLGRSVYVPSAWQRTAIFGLLISIGFLAMTMHADGQDDDSLRDLIAQLFHVEVDPELIGSGMTVFAQVWWGVTVFLSASASHVIYGLRREVTKARQLGQYELTRKLGAGGMGEVYEARHLLLRRATAVKLLRPELAGEKSISRFEREVRATAKLSHPNTVTIFDFGHAANGVFYYAMELLEGGALDDIVALDGPMEPARVVHVLHQVADALTEAHHKGLVHRDIKPGNIMLTRRGGVPDVAKVVDFGLVKEAGSADVSLTGENAILGTPLYLAPEAIRRGDGYEPRSDLYALGGVAYFMLTASHVFEADTTMELLSMHLMESPVPVSERLGAPIPADLERLVMSLLAKSPDDRPASAGALLEQLEELSLYRQWTRKDAERWWRDFGPELRRGPAEESLSTPTMLVELSQR